VPSAFCLALQPTLRQGHRLDQPLDDALRAHAFGLGIEVRDDAVPQDRVGQRLDVLDRDVEAPVHQRTGLGAEDQRVRGAKPGAPLHPFLDEVELLAAPRPRVVGQTHGVPRHFVGNQHLPHVVLDAQDVGAVKDSVRLGPGGARRIGDHLHLVVFGQVGHHHVEQKSIELSFGQRIGAFELDRVLGREHEERPVQRIGPPRRRDVVLLHCLEQRRLGLRRRPVDLVGEDDLREDRSVHETEGAMPTFLVEHLGAGDISRHQVGRELDPLEAEVQDLRERLDQERLRQSRHAGDEAVPAAEKRHQHFIDDLVLPDDDLAQLAEDLRAASGHALGEIRRFPFDRLVHVNLSHPSHLPHPSHFCQCVNV
jgi:hypothetical protein